MRPDARGGHVEVETELGDEEEIVRREVQRGEVCILHSPSNEPIS